MKGEREAYKKCPKCDLNYIREDEDFCQVCLADERANEARGGYSRVTRTFVIKGTSPYYVYDNDNNQIGEVFRKIETDSLHIAEIKFAKKYYDLYRVFHKVQRGKSGGRYDIMTFSEFESTMRSHNGIFTYTGDVAIGGSK